MRKIFTLDQKQLSTKKGAASLYVVIFSTLLLGIITLSYMRIIVGEASRNSNVDLSQSAYDSALAGIEDAKTTLLKYHECLSTDSRSENCNHIINTLQGSAGKTGKLNNEDCDTVNAALYKGTGEVVLAERVSGNSNASTNLLQAYTCVTVAEELNDYRTTLNSGERTVMIPIRTYDINKIQSIVLRWYSQSNGNMKYMPSTSSAGLDTGMPLQVNNSASAYAPPVIYTQLIQTASTFNPRTDFLLNNNTKTNRAEVFLYPKSNNNLPENTTEITAAQFAQTANKTIDEVSGSDTNRLKRANCYSNWNAASGAYACNVVIGIPRPIGDNKRGDNTMFLRVVLPYGVPETDISVSLYSKDSSEVKDYLKGTNANPGLIKFQGVQAKIDSTGRANDLFRRVEARVELVDHYYPYPEFAIESTSDISKNFFITKNCWYTNNGAGEGCDNNNKRK